METGDKAQDQYEEFIDENDSSIKFDEEVDRLDELYFQKLNIQKYPELSEIAVILFIISHGNGNVIDVNMTEISIKSKRHQRSYAKAWINPINN